ALFGPGFRSAAHWAEVKLGIPEKQAQRWISVARHLGETTAIDEAFARGELSWSKVRTIAPIATAETQEDWLEFAKKHTVRRLEEEVRLVGDRGKRPGERLGSKPQRYWLHLPLSERAHVLVESAFTKLRRARKGTASPEELIEEMAELVLAMRLESEDAEDGIEPGADSKRASPFKVLIHVKAETGESWIDTSEGRVELSPEDVQEEIEDGAEVEMVEEFAPRGAAASSATEPSTLKRSICFGERGSVPKELRAAPATQETRRKVFERHGNRCVICGRLLTLSNRQTHHPEAHAN